MTKAELIEKLNDDLRNEYTHMHFYLYSSFMIQGFHRLEIGEWLLAQAQGEFKHIQEFSKMIVGLGGVPTHEPKNFPVYRDAYNILDYARRLETEVVENYVNRMKECELLGGVDGTWVELFLENQVIDSRSDLDEITELLKELR